MSYLVLVRHGESRWNLQNRFTGCVNVPLSAKGLEEAKLCAFIVKKISFDIAFTSELVRAQETLLVMLSQADITGLFIDEKSGLKKWGKYTRFLETPELPIIRSCKLNERYYGKLQGLNKNSARKRFGEEQVFRWRRGYKTTPPGAESLYDVYKRSVPYFKKKIISQLEKGKNVLVSAHGNSLRAIIKYIEDIGDEEIPFFELATGKPVVYKFVHGRFMKLSDKEEFNRPTKFINPYEKVQKKPINKQVKKKTSKKSK